MLVKASGREREAALRLGARGGPTSPRSTGAHREPRDVAARRSSRCGVRLVGTRALQALQPRRHAARRTFDFDWVVLGYVLAITTVSALLFGIAPALWSSRRSAVGRAQGRCGRGGSDSRRVRRWGERLVDWRSSARAHAEHRRRLLVRSLLQLTECGSGFDPNGVLAARSCRCRTADMTRTQS